jgi:tetratricopeptide (TPR) repeat protein
VTAERDDAVRQKQLAEESARTAERQQKLAEGNATQAVDRLRSFERAVDRYVTAVSESELLDEPGLGPLRQQFLGLARDCYEPFVREHQHDPARRRELARGLTRLARIEAESGSLAKALDDQRTAVATVAAAVAGADGGNDLRAELAAGYDHLGRLYRRTGQPAEAREASRKSVRLWEELCTAGGTENFLRGLARSLHGLANALVDEPSPGPAIVAYRRAIELRQELARTHPDDPTNRRELASAWDELANCLGRSGQVEPCVSAQTEAQALWRDLVRRSPERLSLVESLARSLSASGALSEAVPARAVGFYEEAASLWEQLARLRPTAVAYREHFGEALQGLSLALDRSGKTEAGEKALERALAVKQQLLDEHRDVSDYQYQLAVGYMRRGERRRDGHRMAEAAEDFRRATPMLEALVSRSPPRPVDCALLARNQMALGQIEFHNRNVAPSRAAYERAVALFEEQDRLSPGQADIQADLGICCVNLGLLARTDGQARQALDWYDRAERLLKPLAGHARLKDVVANALNDCAGGQAQARELLASKG